MKILQIVPHYVPAYHFGGVLHVAHALSKSLVAQGHSVRVVTTRLKDPHHDLEVGSEAPVDVDGAHVFYEPTLSSKYARYWGFSPSLAWRVWREAAWADVALIHFHYQFASLIGGRLAQGRRTPFVMFTHGSLNHYGVSARSKARKHLYLKLTERRNFRRALFTAYCSQEEMENSFQFGRCQVVPNGITPTAFVELPPLGHFRRLFPQLQERLFYLYLGRLDAGKGLDLLLSAFRLLADVNPQVHLILAGGDERGYEAILRRMVDEMKLGDHVTFAGLIGGADKLGALQDADIFVLPSRSEGLSIAMLEAMFMGLPIVITDRMGLWRRVQEEACGLVVPLEADGAEAKRLFKALCQLADDSNRAALGARGRTMVQNHFTWDAITAQLVRDIQDKITRCKV